MSTATTHIKTEKQLVPAMRFNEFEGDWIKSKLIDWSLVVLDGDRGSNYPSGDEFQPEGYCLFMNAKNVTKTGFSFEHKMFITKEKDEILRKGKLEREDLVLTTRGSVGHIAYYDQSVPFDNLRINSGMVLIRNENDLISSKFIYINFFTPFLIKQISTISFGSAQPQLTVKEINKFKFSIPSLPEQQKIASFLSAVDEKIQHLTKKKELLDRYKKGVMQQLFSGQLRFKDENGNPYPDWEEKRLGEVFGVIRGKGISKEQLVDNGETKCILYGQLYTTYNEVVFDVLSRTDTNEGVLSMKGDLLVPSSTTTTGIDLANVTALNEEGVLLGGDISILRSKIDSNNVFYAYYLSNHKKYEIAAFAQGSTIVHLSYNHFKVMIIDIPVIEEQQKIATYLSSIDTKIERVNNQITQTQTFKKGLLQQMFVGA